MSSDRASKPHIIVVARIIDPFRGSEPGKAWGWSSALSRYFRLHLVTHEQSVQACSGQAIVEQEGWTFHVAHAPEITSWKFPQGHFKYLQWLASAMAVSRQVIREFPISGLCHVTIGSFRMLPRYDRLGIPYTVGPLGGGECAPLRFTWERSQPLHDKISESVRPVFNNSFALVPRLRSCLGGANLVLTTSRETDRVVRRIGARKTAVVFSDSFESPIDSAKVNARRSEQVDEVKTHLRLLWQGRAVWWKGPDIALLLLRRALDQGLRVDMTMVSSWDGAFGKRVKQLAEKLSLSPHIRWLGNMSRNDFLEMALQHHGLIATSLHDSGGIPVVEAQALGMPCITLGFGGHLIAACPDAGQCEITRNTTEFVEKSVACLANWQQHPDAWLEQSKKAVLFSQDFKIDRLRDYVRDLIVPAFK